MNVLAPLEKKTTLDVATIGQLREFHARGRSPPMPRSPTEPSASKPHQAALAASGCRESPASSPRYLFHRRRIGCADPCARVRCPSAWVSTPRPTPRRAPHSHLEPPTKFLTFTFLFFIMIVLPKRSFRQDSRNVWERDRRHTPRMQMNQPLPELWKWRRRRKEREREGGRREHYTFTIVGFHLLCQNTCGLSAGLFFNLNIPRGSLNKKWFCEKQKFLKIAEKLENGADSWLEKSDAVLNFFRIFALFLFLSKQFQTFV